MMTYLIIGSFLIACACILWLKSSSSKDILLNSSNKSDPIKKSPRIIGDRFLILAATELIVTLKLEPVLENIRETLGLSDENWKKDALPFLHNYIEFVQRLPASESHHHAGDGGLIKHTLDVAIIALTMSKNQSWPPMAPTEEIAQKTAVWKFGIMTAAIMHDVGKTLTGFKVALFTDFDSEPDENNFWLPDTGSMKETGKKYYSVSFPDKKTAYHVHAEIAWTFFQALVPNHVRQWIVDTDSKLVVELRNYLSGMKSNACFHEIITNADMASVSRDLREGSRQKFASAKRTPLIETIMETLKEMLSERGAFFSIATTSGGDLFRQGDYVYMVAKNVPDKVREYLKSNNSKSAPSFPSDNQRIFDTLLEYGAAEKNSVDASKAIINLNIVFTRHDGEVKDMEFSVLKFHINKIYPDPDHYPTEFKGVLIELDKASRKNQKKTEPENFEQNNTEAVINTTQIQENQTLAEADHSEPVQITDAELKDIADFKIIPTGELKNEPTFNIEVGNIDSVLKTFNLMDVANEDEDESQEEIQKPAIESLLTIPNVNPSELIEQTNRSSIKPRKESIQNNSKKSKKTLEELFGQSSKVKPRKPESNVLDTQDLAAAGKSEIIQNRLDTLAQMPRPVHVESKNKQLAEASLADVQSLVTSDFESDESKDQTQENKPRNTVEASRNEIGLKFINWLATGLSEGRILYNDSNAPIHFIDKGMLLVTPAIFREFSGGFFNKNDPSCLGKQAQSGFESLKLHERTKRTALHHAIATKSENKLLFTCYFIPERNLKHIIQPASRPENNVAIGLKEDLLTTIKPRG